MAIIDTGDRIIDYDNGWDSIILMEQHECRKVDFDIKRIKQISSVYTAYNIPSNEHIVAYCKGNIPFAALTVEGIIFTDQAVYFYPNKRSYNGEAINYIPYNCFGSFIFYQNGSHGEIFALTQTEDTKIFGPSVLLKNTAGFEVLRILSRIQTALFSRNCAARDTFHVFAAENLKRIREAMGVEGLSPKDDGILSWLICIPFFTNEAIKVKAEYIYRRFDMDKYKEFVNSVSKLVPSIILAELKEIPSEFYSNYIQYLTNSRNILQYSTLSKICYNIEHLEEIKKMTE